MPSEPAAYPGYRFPAEHESLRPWCLGFGADLARKLRRQARWRSLIAGRDASPLYGVADVPAGSMVLSAVGTGPPHVGVQGVGAPM